MRFLRAIALLLALTVPASAVNFPATLDSNTTLTLLQNGDVYVASLHNNLKDAILALEDKVGVDSSAVVTSLDYLVKNAASVDPGHTHSSSGVTFADGSAASPGLRFGSPVTDTNTGIFHPGVGVLAFSSVGTERLRINGTGIAVNDASGADFPIDVAGIVRIQGASSLCFGGTGAADNDTCIARSAAHVATITGSLVSTDVATGDTNVTLNGIAAKTGNFLSIKLLPADANPIIAVSAAGLINFGAGGASAVDTNLYRSAASVLKTDDSLTVDGPNITLTNDGGASQNIVAGTVNGVKIGTNAAQKLGFFNATPVVQPTASTALLTALQNLGLITSGTYSGDITTTGTVTTGGFVGEVQAAVLANGANNNFALNDGTKTLRITGPTGAFSLSGITGGVDGRELNIVSTVSQTFTITNDATSTATNRILTQTLADVVCNATEPASVTLVYDATTGRWRATGYVNCTNP